MTHSPRGLPGLRGADHIGITVPDLDMAAAFFVNVLGAEAFYEMGPMAASDDWMKTNLDVHPRAEVKRLRFFRVGHNINIEAFEYTSPDQRIEPPRNSDIGAHHIALYVNDFEKALAHLKSWNIEIMGEPTVRRSGPSDGQTWVYFKAPWGLQFELLSYPNGKGYEKTTERRLWDPRNPAA